MLVATKEKYVYNEVTQSRLSTVLLKKAMLCFNDDLHIFINCYLGMFLAYKNYWVRTTTAFKIIVSYLKLNYSQFIKSCKLLLQLS